VIRDKNGEINVLENRCAHRGIPVCWKNKGEEKALMCPYHQWTYDLTGNLVGVPFLRGAFGNPGMPADFDKSKHGLRRLRVARRAGTIWASFAEDAPDFVDYAGPELIAQLDRQFGKRKVRLLGYTRQLLPINWKLYFDNTRDPYHASLLHTFFASSGTNRPDTKNRKTVPLKGGMHQINSWDWTPETVGSNNEATREMKRLRNDFRLNDDEVVTYIDEFGDNTIATLQIFPSNHLLQVGNLIAMRSIHPKTFNSTELSATLIGFEDDSEQLTRLRLKQANQIGPGGLVSMDDNEVFAHQQPSAEAYPESIQTIAMGGRGTEGVDYMITENLLRAFYSFYRKEMGL
jgi:anthranilate 1,2-dioxygenase large subunit